MKQPMKKGSFVAKKCTRGGVGVGWVGHEGVGWGRGGVGWVMKVVGWVEWGGWVMKGWSGVGVG